MDSSCTNAVTAPNMDLELGVDEAVAWRIGGNRVFFFTVASSTFFRPAGFAGLGLSLPSAL